MLKEFLSSQLFSVIIGSLLTLIVSVIVGKKNVTNSLDEEIAKERIRAYNEIYKIVCQLNHSLVFATDIHIPKDCFLGYISAEEKKYRKTYCFPTMFATFESFTKYKQYYSVTFNENRLFLNQSITNKLSFLDSYLGNVWEIANGKGNSYLHMVGFTLFDEISDLRDDIETELKKFMNSSKKKRVNNNFLDTYHYEYKNKNNTKLKKWFLDDLEIEQFGDFPLCSNCKYCKKCPINQITIEEQRVF